MHRAILLLLISGLTTCVSAQAGPGLPRVAITSFMTGDQALSLDSLFKQDRITIDYRRAHFTLGYSAGNDIPEENFRYYYQLKGIDRNWIRDNGLRRAQYSFLPPGNYTFNVRTINEAGLPSPVTSIRIYVRPPFWKTPWFLALVVVMALVLIYFINDSLVCRSRNEQAMRIKIAENLHNEISDALSSVNLLGEMVRMKMNTDTEAVRNYIFKITESNNQAMEAMDDILWSINPDNDSMTRVAEHMKKMAKSLLVVKNISYNFSVTDKVLRASMDMQTRHNLLLLYKILIRDIAVHAECYHIKIELTKSGQYLQLTIEDDGKSFHENEMDRWPGMASIRKRTEMLHGTIEFRATGRGTRATVTIGVKQKSIV